MCRRRVRVVVGACGFGGVVWQGLHDGWVGIRTVPAPQHLQRQATESTPGGGEVGA